MLMTSRTLVIDHGECSLGKMRCMIALMIVASPALASDPPIKLPELMGAWVLKSPDPRWTCTMEFAEGGVFGLHSSSVIEVHLSNGKVKPANQEMDVAGTYELKQRKVNIRLSPPLGIDQLDFAKVNFGPPLADGSYEPDVWALGALFVGTGKHTLEFTLTKKKP